MKEAVLALQRANGQRDYIALARELVASQGTDAEQAFEEALR